RPQPPLLPLFPGHFQPLRSPQPEPPLAVHAPALPPPQGPEPPVAVPRVLAHPLPHPRHQPPFPLLGLGPLPRRRAVLAQHAAGPPLRHPEPLPELEYSPPPLAGGHPFFCTTSRSICLSTARCATR